MSVINLDEFVYSMKIEEDQIDKVVLETVQVIGMEVLRRVVMKSPVKTGRFRGNWLVELGVETEDTPETPDKAGTATIARGSSVITSMTQPFVNLVVYNSTPYALLLEQGYSKKAPNGMVGITFLEIVAGLQ